MNDSRPDRTARRRELLAPDPDATLIWHDGAPHFDSLASVRLRTDAEAVEQRLGVDQIDPRDTP